MPLATLLRRCLVLASRLGSQPAIDWINWELEGYPNEVQVPDYRKLSLIIKANLIDLGRRAEGWTVPTAFLGENPDNWTKLDYRSGVGEIEHFLKQSNSTICFSMGNLPLFLQSREFT